MENMFKQQRTGNKVAFKYHLTSYLLMNIFFWFSWFGYGRSMEDQSNWLVWPLYPMLFGAVGLLFHFLAIYILPVMTNETNEYKEFK